MIGIIGIFLFWNTPAIILLHWKQNLEDSTLHQARLPNGRVQGDDKIYDEHV